jgi:hypothetical protein
MRVTRSIPRPLTGEHLLQVDPEPASQVEVGWHRRLNLYGGRALSARALQAEQAGRAGRLSTRGQSLSPGVVSGLEVELEHATPVGGRLLIRLPGERRPHYRLSAGYGLAASGEDVIVPSETRLDIYSLRVAALGHLHAGLAPSGSEALPHGFGFQARELGWTLQEFINAGVDLPRVAILVLEPVVAEMISAQDLADPCPPPCSETENDQSFDDWQLVDGSRLVHFTWPSESLYLPPLRLPPPGSPVQERLAAIGRWRNRLAYTIFEAESRLGPEERLPWEDFGVALGLVGFDQGWRPLFVDRYAVTRLGGRPKRRSQFGWLPGDDRAYLSSAYWLGVAPQSNHPFLWQARLQQLSEQVAEALANGVPQADLDQHFRLLPPAGLLPKGVLEFATGDANAPSRVRLGRFFPTSYSMEAAPAPVEQLDIAIEASASLEPYDLGRPDQVRLLVPVPQTLYDPALLQVERVDPIFEQKIEQLSTSRNRLLRRRQEIRDRANVLYKALHGKTRPVPTQDPQATDDEMPDAGAPEPPIGNYGTTLRGAERVAIAMENLKQALAGSGLIKKDTAIKLDSLAGVDPQKLKELTEDRLSFDVTKKTLTLRGMLKIEARDELRKLSNNDRFIKAINDIHVWSQKDDLSRLDELGLLEFIAFLQRKIDQADDKVNLGFVRVQADIYRLRQLMRGVADGTRLATSPALASIARGDSAVATKEEINAYLSLIKATGAAGTAGGQTPTGDQPPPEPAGDLSPSLSGGGGKFENITTSGNLLKSSLLFSAGSKLPILDVELPGTKGQVESTSSKPTSVFGTSGLEAMKGGFEFASPGTGSTASEKDVVEQSPVVGAVNVRSTSIAERLEAPKAEEAKLYSVSSKFEVVNGLQTMDMSVEDVDVVGLPLVKADGTVDYDEYDQPFRTAVSMIDLDASQILKEPPPKRTDEGRFFAGSVDMLDHTIAVLRRTEGKIAGYRRALELCQTALEALNRFLRQADDDAQATSETLNVVRHDLALARALLADERKRVADINAQRDQVVNESVRFIAYYRPRASSNILDAPAATLLPGLVEPAVPACLESNLPAPDELRRMVDLLRDAPAAWFHLGPGLIKQFDRIPELLDLIQVSAQRATLFQQTSIAQPVETHKQASPQSAAKAAASQATTLTQQTLQTALRSTLSAQTKAISAFRAKTAAIDLSVLVQGAWLDQVRVAVDVVTLGDLIEGRHVRSDLARAASRELDQIRRVSTCLYAAFGAVRPALRLAWAQELSQYDQAADLRNLGVLPGWGEIDYLERRAMQELVEWLYGRIDQERPQALSLFHDLARVCLLLASHAPVRGILAGRIPRPTRITPGILFDLIPDDLAKVRVGMRVDIMQSNLSVAEALVENMNGDQVAARVTMVKKIDEAGKSAGSLALEAGTLAYFNDPRS